MGRQKTEKQELIRWEQSYKGEISGEGREEVRVEKKRRGMDEWKLILKKGWEIVMKIRRKSTEYK